MSKHSGINATREALKDQLVLAADAIIEMRAAERRADRTAEVYFRAYQECKKITEESNRWMLRIGLVLAGTGIAGAIAGAVL